MRLVKSTSAVILLFMCVWLGSTLNRTVTAAGEPTGKFAGVVLDVNDARVVGATVTIQKGSVKRSTESNDEGEFEVSLPAGDYQVSVEANGFSKFSYSPVTVKVDETKRLKIRLKVAVSRGLVPAWRR